jgi:hypothetical protein
MQVWEDNTRHKCVYSQDVPEKNQMNVPLLTSDTRGKRYTKNRELYLLNNVEKIRGRKC